MQFKIGNFFEPNPVSWGIDSPHLGCKFKLVEIEDDYGYVFYTFELTSKNELSSLEIGTKLGYRKNEVISIFQQIKTRRVLPDYL